MDSVSDSRERANEINVVCGVVLFPGICISSVSTSDDQQGVSVDAMPDMLMHLTLYTATLWTNN